jgi:hypothetical protein
MQHFVPMGARSPKMRLWKQAGTSKKLVCTVQMDGMHTSNDCNAVLASSSTALVELCKIQIAFLRREHI